MDVIQKVEITKYGRCLCLGRVCVRTGEDLRFWIFLYVPFPHDENIILLSYFHCVKFMYIVFYIYIYI